MRDFSSDLKELRRRLDEACSYLNVNAGRIRLSELEVTISAPDLWDDQDRAKKVNAEYANLKGDVAEYDVLAASIEDAEVLAIEYLDSMHGTEHAAFVSGDLV